MIWVGIDPGKKGGFALVDEHNNIEAVELPEILLLDKLLKKHKTIINHLYLEKAMHIPREGTKKQGAQSRFNYGESYGMIRGILIANEIPHSLVHPLTWQAAMFKHFKKSQMSSKEKALAAANLVFKKNDSFWLKSSRSKKPHDGMVDAACLAFLCRVNEKLAK